MIIVKCPWGSCMYNKNHICNKSAIELEQIVVAEVFEDELSACQLENFEECEDNYLLKCKNYTRGGKVNE